MKKAIKEWLAVLPFIGVSLVLISIFVIFPLFKNLYISLSDYSIMPGAETPFIGLENYIDVFGSDLIGPAMRNSTLMVLVTVPLQMIFGLLLAYMIHSIKVGKTFFKTAYYIPVVTSWVVIAYIFKYLFAGGNGGMINFILLKLGCIQKPIGWFQNTWTALMVTWIVSVWKGVGWTMVIYLVGLEGISQSLHDSASLDGANEMQKLIKIVIPILLPVTLFLLVNLTIGAFNSFIQTFIMTEGAPLNTTHVMMSLMYSKAFDHFEFGQAAAIGIIQGVLVLIIVMLQKFVIKDTNLYI